MGADGVGGYCVSLRSRCVFRLRFGIRGAYAARDCGTSRRTTPARGAKTPGAGRAEARTTDDIFPW